MNTTLSTTRGRHDHPPEPAQRVAPAIAMQPTSRVGLLDRAALTLGIALIKWGRRPRLIETRERRATRVEHQLARIARERAHERRAYLTLPIR